MNRLIIYLRSALDYSKYALEFYSTFPGELLVILVPPAISMRKDRATVR